MRARTDRLSSYKSPTYSYNRLGERDCAPPIILDRVHYPSDRLAVVKAAPIKPTLVFLSPRELPRNDLQDLPDNSVLLLAPEDR